MKQRIYVVIPYVLSDENNIIDFNSSYGESYLNTINPYYEEINVRIAINLLVEPQDKVLVLLYNNDITGLYGKLLKYKNDKFDIFKVDNTEELFWYVKSGYDSDNEIMYISDTKLLSAIMNGMTNTKYALPFNAELNICGLNNYSDHTTILPELTCYSKEMINKLNKSILTSTAAIVDNGIYDTNDNFSHYFKLLPEYIKIIGQYYGTLEIHNNYTGEHLYIENLHNKIEIFRLCVKYPLKWLKNGYRDYVFKGINYSINDNIILMLDKPKVDDFINDLRYKEFLSHIDDLVRSQYKIAKSKINERYKF
ncbi:MAG: hypothetical protein ACTTIP_06045 [Dialister pneumosintes]